jgi:hypothetical protein
MEIIVEKDWNTRQVKVYLKEMQGDIMNIIGQENGVLVSQIIERTDYEPKPLKPLLEMPEFVFNDMATAMVDYMSNKGHRTKNESVLEGKLSATEKHLEDLRTHFTKVLDKVVGS